VALAMNWATDFHEIGETKIELTDNQRLALRDLVQLLEKDVDEKTVQNSIFNIAKDRNVETKKMFESIYKILVGMSRGPRLGPYIVAMGRENVSEALKRAVETSETMESTSDI
jgi:lysyl-tRNA synthetase class 1